MKKTGIILIVLAVLAFLGVGMYNGMVSQQEEVNKAMGDLQSTYQRRADLIPNLVETVKGYAKHEEETFKAVVEARAKATQITLDPSNTTPEQLEAFQKAQGELGSALGKLIAVSENYPDLKANEQFKELQVQLEGTENRINTARQKFNEKATEYNVSIRSFPKNLFAGMFGFTKVPVFEAEPGAQSAPKVSFD